MRSKKKCFRAQSLCRSSGREEVLLPFSVLVGDNNWFLFLIFRTLAWGEPKTFPLWVVFESVKGGSRILGWRGRLHQIPHMYIIYERNLFVSFNWFITKSYYYWLIDLIAAQVTGQTPRVTHCLLQVWLSCCHRLYSLCWWLTW